MTGKRKLFYVLLLFSVSLILWKSFQYFTVVNEYQAIHVINSSETQVSNKIKVSVYYEALCSDSRNFFLKQLEPAYNELRNHIQLDFIPYGKAKTIEKDGVITFKCQHAALECIANKVHACVLLHVKDQDLQLQYLTCMIKDNMIPYEIGEKCAKQLRIAYDPISECAHGDKASLLLKEHGIRTQAVTPAITFIPHIELDTKQTVPLVLMLKNFKKELCNILDTKPRTCL